MRLIYLSPTPWHGFSQRPHELVRCFHEKTGEPVLWIEPYPTRLPTLGDLRRLPPVVAGTPLTPHGESPPWLTIIRPHALPIEPIPGSGWVNRLLWQAILHQARQFAQEPTMLGIGKPSNLALRLLNEPLFNASFYDAMDNFPEFYTGFSRWAMARKQQQMAQAVTTVLASSSELQAHMLTLSNNVKLLPNACATERLPERVARNRARRSHPVLGYVGTIAKWFSWEIVVALAKAFPQAEIRLIGPVHTATPQALPDNIVLRGELCHEQAVHAMADFDVGLIPFRCDALTRYVDPIKYYEYRALGLPVISTAFGEMANRAAYPGTFLLNGPQDIHQVMDQALNFDEPDEHTQHFRHSNSWSARFGAAIP